jgi:valyl-tRNA synthetase
MAALTTFFSVFDASLRLLSPFMPFITEEIWQTIYKGTSPFDRLPSPKSIALTRYPQAADFPQSEGSVEAMKTLQDLIVTVRGLRKELGVPEKEATPIALHGTDRVIELAQANADILAMAKMARVASIEIVVASLAGANARSSADFDVAVVYERQIDVAAERERLTKDLAKYEKGLAAADKQLGNGAFMGKAPAHIVEGLRKQAAETKILYDKTTAALNALPPSEE